MTLILVVDDDPGIRTSLAEEIESSGFAVITAEGANEALALVEGRKPDLIVTDLSMPGGDGFSLITAVRRARATPIIVISVRGREQDKVRALDLGADDYVVKPFSVAEVLARVRAQLRRSGIASTEVLHFADLMIDPERRKVVQGGREIHLTPIELAILQLLATNCGKPLTFGRIIASVWPGAVATTPDTVRVHVGAIRRKIEPDPSSPRYLVTEPWVGYRFIGEPV